MIDIQKIMGMIPHRYPFLLVDRVLEIEKSKSIVALKNVSCNEPYFQGHFPKIKIMPGVLVVEALAQAGGILLAHSIPDPETKLVVLSKISNAKFRKPVVPGDQLILKIKVLKHKQKFIQTEGTAYVGDEIVAEAAILASIMDLEDWHGKE